MKNVLEDGRFLVYHVGNEDLGIKGTGHKKYMSEEQFTLLKNKGWEKVPDTGVPEDSQADTGSESEENTTDKNPPAETSMDYTPTEAIAKIKEYAEAEDFDGLKAFVDPDESRQDILDAVDKVTNPDNEEEE